MSVSSGKRLTSAAGSDETINIMIVGEFGDGKTTIVNGLCDHDRSEAPPGGNDPRGTSIWENFPYPCRDMNGVKVNIVDTHGVNDDERIQNEIIGDIHRFFLERGQFPGGISGLVVTTPVSNRRIGYGACVASDLVETGVIAPAGTEKYGNVILCGTKLDIADREDIKNFMDGIDGKPSLKQLFFANSPHRSGPCVMVSQNDYTPLLDEIRKLPAVAMAYQKQGQGRCKAQTDSNRHRGEGKRDRPPRPEHGLRLHQEPQMATREDMERMEAKLRDIAAEQMQLRADRGTQLEELQRHMRETKEQLDSVQCQTQEESHHHRDELEQMRHSLEGHINQIEAMKAGHSAVFHALLADHAMEIQDSLEEQKKQIKEQKTQIEEQKTQMEKQKEQIEADIKSLALKEEKMAKEMLEREVAKIEKTRTQIEEQKTQIESQKEQIEADIKRLVQAALNEEKMAKEMLEKDVAKIEETGRRCLTSVSGKCFPASAVLYTPAGPKMVAEIRAGEKVLAVDSSGCLRYDDVYFFGHANSMEHSKYVCLSTSSGKVLRASPKHFIALAPGACSPRWSDTRCTYAEAIEVGHYVWVVDARLGCEAELRCEEIVEVSSCMAKGLFNPYTLTGTVVTDEVVASAHSDWFLDDICPSRWQGQLPGLYQALLLPGRLLYRTLGSRAADILDVNNPQTEWSKVALGTSPQACAFFLASLLVPMVVIVGIVGSYFQMPSDKHFA